MKINISDRRIEVDRLILNIRQCIDINLDNEECKKEFFNFIEKLKEIKPFSNEEYINYNKFSENKLSCIFVDYRMYYIKYLTDLKKWMLKENWKNVLKSVSELDRACEILNKKIYYSIINIL